MVYKKKGTILNIEILFAMLAVMIMIAGFFAIFGESFYDKSCQKDYLEGVNLIKSIKFDDLQTSTLSDGTKIKVSPSAEYPADKIVTYKEIVFPVENHDGKSKAVAMYSRSTENNDTTSSNDYWILIVLVIIFLGLI